LKQITENVLVGHLEGLSSLDVSPKSENDDTIADFPRFPGEVHGNVGFTTQKQPIQSASKKFGSTTGIRMDG
jgi:hypothetical protein